MTFEQFYKKILIQRWSLIVFCFLFVGLGAFIGSSVLMKPLYQSTALVEVVVRSGGDPFTKNNVLASQQLASMEAELATIDPLLRQVASHYPGLSVDDLAKEVTASSRTNTQLFEIDVLDPNPTRAANLANAIAATLIAQQLQVTQQNPAQGSFLVVAQSARPAANPTRPDKLLNTTAGLLTGLLLGLLLALVFEQLDTRVRTEEVLAQFLDWPILATLRRTVRKENGIHSIGYHPNIESYGILHTNIELIMKDKPLYTLVVTSGRPGDGKSAVATNLAIRMAKAGKNTLLIDANLRHPTLHEHFGIPAHAMGFSNALLAFRALPANVSAHREVPTSTTYTGPSSTSIVTDESSLDPFVQAVDIPNLYVVPSGPLPPNPSDLLNSKAMQRFFAALNTCGTEVVIFDTPSLLGLPDAAILASKVDGTLVVVDTTHARKGNLKQVKTLLGQAGARVLGCVLNKERRSRKNTPYSYNNYDTGKQSRGEISLHIPARVKEAVLVLPMGLALGMLLSRVVSAMTTPSVTGVLSSLPPTSLLGFAIATLSMALILILRQYELAAVVVAAVKLYVDWYLGLTFVAPTLALGLLLIFFFARSPQYPWAGPRALWLWVLFLVLTLLQTDRAPSLLYGAQYYVENIFSAFVVFWLGTVIARDSVHVRRFFQMISVFGALIAIHTIIEATTGIFLLESSRNAAHSIATSYLDASARAIHRATSFFLSTNSDGAFLSLTVFVPLALLFTTRLSFAWKILFIAEIFLILIAMLFTYSTGAWFSLFIGFIVFIALVGRMRHGLQLVLLLFAVGIVGMVAFPSQLNLLFQHSSDPGELALRTAVWQTAIRVIEAFPLTGLGIGRDVYLLGYQPFRVAGEYDLVNHPHNSYLEFAALGGLPVGIVFIALLSVALWLALRNWRQIDSKYRPLLAGGVAAVIALSWYSLSNAGWTVAPLLTVGWMILGVVSSPLLLKKNIVPGV